MINVLTHIRWAKLVLLRSGRLGSLSQVNTHTHTHTHTHYILAWDVLLYNKEPPDLSLEQINGMELSGTAHTQKMDDSLPWLPRAMMLIHWVREALLCGLSLGIDCTTVYFVHPPQTSVN